MPAPTRRAPGRWLWLEPFAAGLWILFVVWTVLVAVVWSLRIGEAEVVAWSQRQFHLPPLETGAPPSPFQDAFVSLLRWIDPTWAMLAAANAYAFTATREGLGIARRWAGIILAGVALVAWFSAKTGWPLGPLRYTDLLGARIGPVPLGLPLLWLAVVLGARDLMLRVRPGLAQAPLALGVGALALIFDVALEPVASKERVFWLWPPGSVPAHLGAPVQCYVTWFCVAAGLAFLLREKQVATIAPPVTRSPAAVYALLLAVLLLGDLARWRS
jgi:hypothetical protein